MEYVGKCARLHGHNARVEIVLEAGRLDPRGFVMDFDQLEATARRWIDDTLDHRLFLRHDDPLCAVLEAQGEVFVKLPHNPTAEHFAEMIFRHLAREGLPVVRVRFHETDTSVAEYAPTP
jgi:6-pyruvoyltetrahydropterin/6-carboxytetrahydropterin synthase